MKAQHGHHVIPKRTLFIVFGALVGLTIITGVTAQMDFGPLNVPLALAIAGTKATLVVMFFMALKYDSRVNSLVFTLGVVFALIFLTFTLTDTVFRGDLGNVGTETIWDAERREELLLQREAELTGGAGGGVVNGSEGAAVDTSAVQDETGDDEARDVEQDAAAESDAAGAGAPEEGP